jgi:hypothetical protein
MRKNGKVLTGVVAFCLIVTVTGMVWAAGLIPDGTVTTGNLVWLQDADSFGRLTWDQAASQINNLASRSHGLSDGSKPGDWRLPTKSELESRVRNVSGFNNVSSEYYWSNTTEGSQAWAVSANYPSGKINKGNVNHVWPVRSIK